MQWKCLNRREAGHHAAILMDIRMPVMDGLPGGEADSADSTEGRRQDSHYSHVRNAFEEEQKGRG